MLEIPKMTRFLSLILFTLVCGGLARANQINLVCSSMGPGNSANATIVCPQFNSDGVLTLITIQLTGSLDGSITLNNSDSMIDSGQATASTMFSFGPLLGFSTPIVELTATASTGNQKVPSKGSDTTHVSSGNVSATDTNSTNVSGYQGSGTFEVPVTTQTSSTISGGGNLGGSVATQAAVSGDVSYTFTPSALSAGSRPEEPLMPIDPVTGIGSASSIPEPSTWFLAAFALIVIYGLRRRHVA